MLRRLLRRIFPSDADADNPVSIVLLLRELRMIDGSALKSSVERAFGPLANQKRHIIQKGPITLVVEGEHAFNLIVMSRPYDIQDPPSMDLWSQHHAWWAVDHMGGRSKMLDRIAMTAKLAIEMCDENCVAIYQPMNGKIIPNDQALRSKLQKIAGH